MATLFVDKIDPQSGTTLSLGSSGDTLQATAGTTNNLGISEADNWRITVFQSINADTDTLINSSWERNDTDFEKIGTGLTENSGIVVLDLLFANNEIYKEAVMNSVLIKIDAVGIPIARPDNLIKIKKLSGRPQDLIDIKTIRDENVDL